MLERVKRALCIDDEAINLMKTIAFLCVTAQEQEQLIEECQGKDCQYINRYLIKLRKEKILKLGYDDQLDFSEDFQRSKISAMERLCQEPLNEFKLANLKSNDPVHIFNIHRQRGRFVRFNELALYA
ncbi:hypothetical protein [Paenibacillus sp. XY044]|uniref:hypothetical protein n=1 Tax=Paenibacillus sp. XY044 TaxID=2026089 RepID=UPI000B97F27E|nr:hypothetical protein [Paenibacillus sp. XY044]OZB98080.1 hypothetical protein CJP46_02620 [Paenibacillus sp. XY044]